MISVQKRIEHQKPYILFLTKGGASVEIFGTYTKTIFRNEVDGFTIFKFRLSKPIIDYPLTEVTCKGNMQSALLCTPMRLSGKMQHDDYGSTFVVEKAEPFSDSESVTIEYLSSKLFCGIAEATAAKIVAVSGPDIFTYVQQENAREELLKIKGMSEEKVDTLIDSVCHSKVQKEILDYITVYGGSFAQAETLFDTYGINALEYLKTKPYEIGDCVDLPFRVCDCIAKENGVQYDDTTRVRALILNVIKRCYYSGGDMYVSLERVFRGVEYTAKNLSAFPGSPISCGLIVAALGEMKKIVSEVKLNDDAIEVRYYLKRAYFDEKSVADNVKRLQRCRANLSIESECAVTIAENKLGIKYSDTQKSCFKFLESSGIKIITGGPGTGKSTVINGLIYAYKAAYPDNPIGIMAPTGRAAQRISEITSHQAGTIHRSLNILPYGNDMLDSAYDADYPADFIIIDEASMVDTSLMALLLKSIKSSSLVVFCGDIDQLPSVGAGNVLQEFIASQKIETVQLDTNFRQKDKSTIIDNAILVNVGEVDLKTDASFQVIECDSEEEIKRIVTKEFIDIYDTNHPYDVQVLSSTRKGQAGIYSLNKSIQNIINDRKTVTAHSNSKFRLKDKIMTTHNNYDIGYFNGDVGIIDDADEENVYVKFLKEEIAIPKKCVQDMELAYACTIHKSQGSEYDTVIIALPAQPSVMLRRNLIYTAITRAKQRILIVTQKGCINKSIITAVDNCRKSALCEKIKIGA